MAVTMVDLGTPEPARADGSAYPWRVDYKGVIACADTAGEAITRVIPDYWGKGTTEALMARYKCATAIADRLQSTFCQATDETEHPILSASKSCPVALRHWGGAAPLVLISTDYSPYTWRALPEGNVVVLDPSTEERFLASLSNAGVIALRAPAPRLPGIWDLPGDLTGTEDAGEDPAGDPEDA